MRALVNGVEGGTLQLSKGETASLVVMVLADAGTLINVTADTITLEIYDRSDRRNAATVTVTCSQTTATAGLCAAAISLTNSNLLTTGTTYYVLVKRDIGAAGTSIDAADKMTTVQVV